MTGTASLRYAPTAAGPGQLAPVWRLLIAVVWLRKSNQCSNLHHARISLNLISGGSGAGKAKLGPYYLGPGTSQIIADVMSYS